MKPFKLILALGLGVLLAGCASIEPPSCNAPFTQDRPVRLLVETSSEQASLGEFVFEEAQPSYRVEKINVIVPKSLLVSEANRYYPSGDIVWREDPPGDRHAQVAAIFEDAMARGAAKVQGDVPIIIDIQVLRFHALTEKTRYTVGGIHSIKFGLSIRSAETGLLLEERRVVQADLVGYGGQRAITAERQGQTQKVRITAHLAHVIEKELSDPEGFINPKLGMIQVLNNRF